MFIKNQATVYALPTFFFKKRKRNLNKLEYY